MRNENENEKREMRNEKQEMKNEKRESDGVSTNVNILHDLLMLLIDLLCKIFY